MSNNTNPLRAAILSSDDLLREPIAIPEWGVTVYVRTMTGMERDGWEASALNEKGQVAITGDALANLRARLAVICLVDEDGGQIFRTKDAKELGGKNAAALDRIFDVAKRLNRLGEDDIKELAGN